jgi:hypothetical protein
MAVAQLFGLSADGCAWARYSHVIYTAFSGPTSIKYALWRVTERQGTAGKFDNMANDRGNENLELSVVDCRRKGQRGFKGAKSTDILSARIPFAATAPPVQSKIFHEPTSPPGLVERSSSWLYKTGASIANMTLSAGMLSLGFHPSQIRTSLP